ncbi:hypothetical protein SAMN05892883_3879 [Jatrophihabitans sp. GAS493]|uniref:hypothetical protein n=1 Tax=Jatrophihabitans sp. GAS493 TaxID=1907575 RepID=UPI000BB97BBD|nr:hypothetical protein [Jatrophihabitans sp. GAS493]SOD74689.1 hypothetical protein SAMN05892883_3879 [Jatrophihabitans sp. GAS493]
MRLSLLVGVAIGYILGARAGRERYEQIARVGRKVRGSQTVQSTAGVLHAQVDGLRSKAVGRVTEKLNSAPTSQPAGVSTNGYHP